MTDIPVLPIGRAQDKIFLKFLAESEDEIRAAYIDALIYGKGVMHINQPAPGILSMKCVSEFKPQGLVERLVRYMMRKR